MSKKSKVIVLRNTSETSIRFIETLFDETGAMLSRYGEDQSSINKLCQGLIREVCRCLGGTLLYIGKNNLLEAQQRRQSIRDDYNSGATCQELATKYQLSMRQIHAIIHEIRDTAPAKSATKGVEFIAIAATRMFMSIGKTADNAAIATRGLLAVICARFGGTHLTIPTHKCIDRILRMIDIHRMEKAGYSHLTIARRFQLTEEQVAEISGAYPVRLMPDASELPKIRTRLNHYANVFNDYSEVSELLHDTARQISRAEQIIINLEKADTAKATVITIATATLESNQI